VIITDYKTVSCNTHSKNLYPVLQIAHRLQNGDNSRLSPPIVHVDKPFANGTHTIIYYFAQSFF
jgi:hypothetical protein